MRKLWIIGYVGIWFGVMIVASVLGGLVLSHLGNLGRGVTPGLFAHWVVQGSLAGGIVAAVVAASHGQHFHGRGFLLFAVAWMVLGPCVGYLVLAYAMA